MLKNDPHIDRAYSFCIGLSLSCQGALTRYPGGARMAGGVSRPLPQDKTPYARATPSMTFAEALKAHGKTWPDAKKIIDGLVLAALKATSLSRRS